MNIRWRHRPMLDVVFWLQTDLNGYSGLGPVLGGKQTSSFPDVLRSAMTDDFPFAVERWSADAMRVDQLLAAAGNLQLAKAAFQEAVHLYPDAIILLRNRARIVEQHNWPR